MFCQKGQRDGLSPELTESGTGGRFGSREEREHKRGEERAGLFFQLHGRRETPGTKEGRKERPGQTGRQRQRRKDPSYTGGGQAPGRPGLKEGQTRTDRQRLGQRQMDRPQTAQVVAKHQAGRV